MFIFLIKLVIKIIVFYFFINYTNFILIKIKKNILNIKRIAKHNRFENFLIPTRPDPFNFLKETRMGNG